VYHHLSRWYEFWGPLHHTIVRGDEDMSRTPPERLLDRHVDPSQVAFRSNSFFARLAAIKHGMGIGVLGCYMGERESSLERLPFRFPDLSSHLWLLLHVDLRQNARVRAFVHHLEAALKAEQPTFEAPSERKR
jgi:DNA-binding transcriptional LysR family regulator